MSKTTFELNKIYTLSNATAKYSDLNLIGRRSSVTQVPLINGIWNTINTSTIEYGIDEQNFTIKEFGFYDVGFDITVTADTINDFRFEAAIFLVRDLSETLLCKVDIRTLFENKKQNVSLLEYVNLNIYDSLSLKIKYSKGLVHLNYGALFAFRTDSEHHLPQESGLTDYFKLNEANSSLKINAVDGRAPLTSSVISSSDGIGALFENDLNQGLSTNEMKFTQLSSEFSLGFTLSVWFKVQSLYDLREQTGYIYLFTRALDNSAAGNYGLYSLYLDTWTFKFIFNFLDSNGTYRTITTRSYPELFNGPLYKYEFITLSYDSSKKHLRLYVNNVLSESLKISGFSQNNHNVPLFIGRRDESVSIECNSSFYLADVSLFKRELSHYEIELIYKNSNLVSKNNPQYIQSTYNGNSNSSLSLPITASDVNFTNVNATIESVQTKLTAVISQLNNISSSNVSTYSGSIIMTDWALDTNRSVYKKTLLSSVHGILNPWEVIVQIAYNGTYIVGESLCEIEIDSVTNNVFFYVNDVPDGRFVGRFIVVGY